MLITNICKKSNIIPLFPIHQSKILLTLGKNKKANLVAKHVTKQATDSKIQLQASFIIFTLFSDIMSKTKIFS